MQLLKYIQVFILSIGALIFSATCMALTVTKEMKVKFVNSSEGKAYVMLAIPTQMNNVTITEVSPTQGSVIDAKESTLKYQISYDTADSNQLNSNQLKGSVTWQIHQTPNLDGNACIFTINTLSESSSFKLVNKGNASCTVDRDKKELTFKFK